MHSHAHTHTHTHAHTHTHTHTCISAHKAHKLPVHCAKGFANFSASIAMLPPTCQIGIANLYTLLLYISGAEKISTVQEAADMIAQQVSSKA